MTRLAIEVESARERALAGEAREMLSVMMEAVHAPFLSRTLQFAIRCGMFEALDPGPRTAIEVARVCQTAPGATRAMLEVLATTEFVTREGDAYALSELGRKWLVPGNSPCPPFLSLLG